jgi:hypothetical protein
MWSYRMVLLRHPPLCGGNPWGSSASDNPSSGHPRLQHLLDDVPNFL